MPSLVDFRRGFGGIIAALSVVALSVSGALTLSGGVANGVLFLDSSKNASSTSRIKADGNAGTVTSTRFSANGTNLVDGYNINIAGLNGTYGTDGTNLSLGTQTGDSIRFYTANVSRWDINASGFIIPSLTDGTQDIGSQSARAGGIYAVSVSSTNVTSTTLYVGGNTTVNQKSLTGNVVTKSEMAMTNATSTPCAMQNTTGRVLMITSVYVYEASSTSGGDVNFVVGTSSNSFTTSTSPVMNTVIARQALNTVNVTTSTIAGGGIVWEAGDWLVAKSNTTTHNGECMALTP